MINIEKILESREGKTLEFKRDISSLKSIMKTMVAFANTAGGILIIGHEDDGTIRGVSDALQVEERLSNAIADSIAPAMMPEIEIFSIKGRQLVLLKIAHCRGPFYLKSEGSEQGVYIRLGSTNRKAGPEILAELNRFILGVSFDQMPCGETDENNLELKQVQSVFQSVNKPIDKEKLETLGLIVSYAGKKVLSKDGQLPIQEEKMKCKNRGQASLIVVIGGKIYLASAHY